MNTREAGQSQASADALEVAMKASRAASEARVAVLMAQEEMKRLRAVVRAAEKVEAETLRAYEATPYADDVAA